MRHLLKIDFWKNEKLNNRGEFFSIFLNQCGHINLAGAKFSRFFRFLGFLRYNCIKFDKQLFFCIFLIKGVKSGWVLRIELDKSFQKIVEISFFVRFLISWCPKYFLIFIGKTHENDVFRWKSFSAPMFDFASPFELGGLATRSQQVPCIPFLGAPNSWCSVFFLRAGKFHRTHASIALSSE